MDDLLDGQEPHATFHDAHLLSLDIDYRTREPVALWSLYVGDPDASEKPERERCREGRLRLRGLLFWVVLPPTETMSELPRLTADGPLSEAPTPAGRELAKLLPPGAVGWYLFFSDWTDFGPLLRQAIALAREAGLGESATELETRAFGGVYTTSSEWLGEIGDAILQFRSQERSKVPVEVASLVDECLTEVGKVWPRYAPGRTRKS